MGPSDSRNCATSERPQWPTTAAIRRNFARCQRNWPVGYEQRTAPHCATNHTPLLLRIGVLVCIYHNSLAPFLLSADPIKAYLCFKWQECRVCVYACVQYFTEQRDTQRVWCLRPPTLPMLIFGCRPLHTNRDRIDRNSIPIRGISVPDTVGPRYFSAGARARIRACEMNFAHADH